jgi:PDDEXK-like domain of unknown function (DUF3799)
MIDKAPVRFTHLKLMALSAAHYLEAARKETGSMERGTALHSLVLGGKQVLAYPGKVRRGKEYDAFVAANTNAQILTASDYGRAAGMAEAVLRNRQAMEVLAGQHELEIDWTCLGRKCQSHLDVLGGGGQWITELKSAVSSNPDRFAWQSQRMAYNAQLAFYWEAVLQSGLGVPRDAYVVAVESSAPYVVTVMRLTARALDQGQRSFRLWLERLLGCEAANEWPGYAEGIVPLDVPEDDAELVFGGAELPEHDPETGEVAA